MRDARAEVAIDFTVIDAARENLAWCAENDVHAVVGTTGFSDAELADFGERFDRSKANAVIAPNFAIGAILMMRFAEMAAPYFESAEIIELHHDHKIDAPSGTSVRTAQRMAAASKDWSDDPTTKVVAEGARGGLVSGIPIHSVRLRGMVAHQEVLLGTTGQSLSIRHDSYDRSCFMPGVVLAVQKVADMPGLTIGLDALLTVSALTGGRYQGRDDLFERFGIGDDLEAHARREPVVVAHVQLVVGVVAIQVHDDTVREQHVDAEAHEVDRAELGVGDEHDERRAELARRASRCRRRRRAGSARRRRSPRARSRRPGCCP